MLGLFKDRNEKEAKYCCESFKYRHQSLSSMGINIRIIKLSENDVLNLNELEKPYRFFVSSGEQKEGIRIAKIEFCPFCGERLASFYQKDCYINETVDALSI